jgi:hypothetical protein
VGSIFMKVGFLRIDLGGGGGWRFRRLLLLALGGVLLGSAVFLPRWPRAETAWILARIALLALSLAALIPVMAKRQTAAVGPPAQYPFSRRMPFFLACTLAILVLLNGWLNQWRSNAVLSNWADAVSYFTQARIFAQGHLAVASPEPREFFDTPYMFNQGRTYSKYPPGWPALLAAGVWLRLPWILNPLITVLTLAAVFHLGRHLYDDETAAMATGLMAVSVHVVYHATAYFSEPLGMLLATLGVLAVLKALRSGSLMAGFLAGCCWGALFLVRPYTALALAIPVTVCGLPLLLARPRVGCVVAGLIPFAGLVALHLGYNHLSTGSAFAFPFSLYNAHDRLGFGLRALDTHFPLTPYGLKEAFGLLVSTAVMANAFFIPLGFVFAGLALALKPRPEDRLPLLCFVSIVLFHFFYFAQQERYWLPAFFALALLAAKGIRQAGAAIAARLPGYPAQRTARVLFALVAASSLAITANRLWREEIPMRHRLTDPFDRVAEAGLTNAVVFLASSPVPNVGHYIQLAPDGDAPVLFARDLGSRNLELMRRHPDRAAYRYEYDPVTARGWLHPIAPTSGGSLPGAK